MNFRQIKTVYTFFCILLCLIFIAPTLFVTIPLPNSESFSEMWLLGDNNMIETGAFNILLTEPSTVYLGVANHMDKLEYYTVYVKLRNQSQALRETSPQLPSPIKSIFAYHLFLTNNEPWETPFTFSFETVSFEGNISRISTLSINGKEVSVNTTLARDTISGHFRCQILFELWIYNSTISGFQYHNRSVWFWINLIEPS